MIVPRIAAVNIWSDQLSAAALVRIRPPGGCRERRAVQSCPARVGAQRSARDHGGPMHIAAHNWMRAEPIRRTLERMRAQGIDSIEIAGEPDQYDTRELRGLLEEHGQQCWGAV